VTDTTDIGDKLDEHRLELLRRKLAERGLRSQTQAPGRQITQLSDGQRRMWFVQAADATGALLNVCVSYRITGDVDLPRLHDAVNAVARRHSVLRTTYHADTDGEPRLTVHEDLTPGWVEHDLSELSDHARRLRLEVVAQREFATPST
jgi:mycobactin peptide synthetase MbtE